MIELEGAFLAARNNGAQALLAVADPLVNPTRERVAALAIENGLPTISDDSSAPAAGMLLAYAPRLPEAVRRLAVYIDKIFKGAKPADLPIQQPESFDFIINLKTAQSLGLSIPPSVLAQATEVLQ